MSQFFFFFPFFPSPVQVYPTATRALGLGTSSGMARVGALITPFVAQVSFLTSPAQKLALLQMSQLTTFN